ncbi:MAG: DNA-binding protein [Clostridiales bacterium]|uniref:YlxM family DNA-binding protein n=1 Tax=Bovifimicola ammoniilytica TaxID=2981720 RepID=UPI000820CFAC|nr:YlxM family DNA-binding protein [Bovifimicola ammoniilytica]MBD8942153.1 DNA-binding protein [Clostridiales bacterium]MCU6752616.1 YlxM family DNA-binding protein [Bovifimicola ammoniilytica]MDY6329696.1 YlxM family DNA-binding protein [Lachnospiraceae bacterium]SCJ30944.1 putative DNA-binding protein [uncultured Eubacterium sp.]
MIKIVEQSMLYDFYGELLTEHQKNIYEDVVFNDMSPSEIAREEGISRQGVHDLIKRCDKILRDYEDKLHLVERFMQTKKDVELIKKYSNECKVNNNLKEIDEIISISDKILSEI